MFSKEDFEFARSVVRSLELPYDFGIYSDSDYNEDDLSRIVYGKLDYHDFGMGFGVSKLVIIPRSKSFVIKIPFNGTWVYDYEVDDGESYKFKYFRCACDTDCEDYCCDELEKICDLNEAGFGMFTPEMSFVGVCDGHPIYLQEKVICADETDGIYSDASRDKANSLSKVYNKGDTEWVATVIEYYGEDCWKSFVDWNEEHTWSVFEDFHMQNYGYRYDGRPVIFDLSAFRD